MNLFAPISIRLRSLYDMRFEPEGVRALAHIYWRSLLCLVGATFVGALLFGIFELLGALDVLSRAADTSPLPPSSLNRSELTKIVDGFAVRKTQFDAGAQGSGFTDPSR